MGTKSIIKEQVLSDLKLIVRDPMLRIIVIILFMLAFVFRIAVPQLGPFLAPWGLTLPFINPFIVSYMFILMIPIGVGAVMGFLLLEEKDNQTIKALAVTPISLNKYFVFRTIMPIILATGVIMLSVYIVWLVYIEFVALLLITLVSALAAPMWTLFLASFAKNKVQGFTVLKMCGAIFIIPVIAYFIPNLGPMELLFGIAPTYWPVKAYWLATSGDPTYGIYLIVGAIYYLVIIALLLKRSSDVMRR